MVPSESSPCPHGGQAVAGLCEIGRVYGLVADIVRWLASDDPQHSGACSTLIADANGNPTGMVTFPDQPRHDSFHPLSPFSLAVASDGSLAVAVGETCSVGIWRWDPTLQLRWKRILQVQDCAGEVDAEVQLLPNEEVIVGGRYYGALEIAGTPLLSKRTNFGGFLMNFGR